jgi:arsenate reductase-like glutaredoxin family protein
MGSVIQIFGVKNCNETKKAIRYFKERRVTIQFINLEEKGLSKGELESVARRIPLEELIDKEGKQFRKRQLAYKIYDLETELLEDPLLFKTPITRFGSLAAIGNTPKIWDEWIKKL